MAPEWLHSGTPAFTSFLASMLASLVEGVEALTVVLAVGSVRGWRAALSGSAAALVLLLAATAIVGRALIRVPVHLLQLIVGMLLLLFGLRWLRKAVLRSAGLLALHDEHAAFAKNVGAMRSLSPGHRAWDRIAFAASWNITMIEGIEVVFIVVALGAGGKGMLISAGLGAGAALLVVVALGFILHRPLAKVPENKLKFAVGVLLSAFGTFWIGEGVGFRWPGGDWSVFAAVFGYLILAVGAAALLRHRTRRDVQV